MMLVRRPAQRRGAPLAVWWASLAFVVAAVAAAGLLWAFADRWWPATVLLFGPRWTLLLPLTLLIPAALRWDRVMLLPLGLATLVILGPVMGLSTGWRRVLSPAPEGALELGVATFNARGGEGLRLSAGGMLREWRADIAGFQECSGTLRREILALAGVDDWHVDARASLCLATRFPVVAVEEMDREDFEFARGSGLVVTWSLLLPGDDTVHVTNLHLETPRAGLSRIRRGRIASGALEVEERAFLRTLELERARQWTFRNPGPHVVLGDFNTPVESRAYRQAWGDWQNAFSRAGLGLGGTRLNGWIRARIDHVLANDAWHVAAARPGRDLGSDHLPLLATLRLARRRTLPPP